MKKQIFIIDTSAILSGKPINLGNAVMITSPGVSSEFSPGGRDFRAFQLLKEKGLEIHSPSQESLQKIHLASVKTGDEKRLSQADKEILALSVDLCNNKKHDVIILTDDYSIQNVASFLGVSFQSFSQQGITTKRIWITTCQGCKKRFQEPVDICPICGTETKTTVQQKKQISK